MNIWLKHADEIIIVAPIDPTAMPGPIDLAYMHNNISFIEVPSFDLLGIKSLMVPLTVLQIFSTCIRAMKDTDHIHLRCPGNMGLIGCIAQIFFPSKKKTAKYAGNWDWQSKQPWSYRLQQRILRNTFFTKNMAALVYGDWPDTTKNIKPFFTASYSRSEIRNVEAKMLNVDQTLKLIFVGALLQGKNPFLSLCIAEELKLAGLKPEIHFYGDGPERKKLETYIQQKNLGDIAFLHGNVDSKALITAYEQSHFLVFISKSEGWPKVVAEGMFWGCLPIATNVSCIKNMVDNENRGIIIDLNLENDVEKINFIINNPDIYHQKTNKALSWSRRFTNDFFENEIKKLLEN